MLTCISLGRWSSVSGSGDVDGGLALDMVMMFFGVLRRDVSK